MVIYTLNPPRVFNVVDRLRQCEVLKHIHACDVLGATQESQIVDACELHYEHSHIRNHAQVEPLVASYVYCARIHVAPTDLLAPTLHICAIRPARYF